MPQLPPHAKHVLICVGRICQQEGSSETYDALTELLDERGLAPKSAMHGLMGRARRNQGDRPETSNAIKVTRTKCLQPCAGAPVACVYPGATSSTD